jgi:hypothetical protein
VFVQPLPSGGIALACEHAGREQRDELPVNSHKSRRTQEERHRATSNDRRARADARTVGRGATARKRRVEKD